jgi:hypothetical protein
VEDEAITRDRDPRPERSKIAVDPRYHIPPAIGGGEVDRVAPDGGSCATANSGVKAGRCSGGGFARIDLAA